MSEHEHHHDHDENCTCGCHDHDHEHHHEEPLVPGVVQASIKLHDDAKVVSGKLLVIGDYEKVRAGLNEGLTEFAAKINELGGVIGHIKASCEVKTVDMFSVTDTDVMIKTAPEQEMNIILAAIVFFVSEEDALALGKAALEKANIK